MVADADSIEPVSESRMRRLGSLIVEQGVITGTSGRYDQVLKLRPPLTFDRNDADKTLSAIDAALERWHVDG